MRAFAVRNFGEVPALYDLPIPSAEEVYDTTAADVFDAVRASHPDGVEAVLDLVNGSDAIRRDAGILKSGGGLVSTRYAADKEWFAEHQITASNIATLTNPWSSPQGLTKVARMLADGTITARIHSIIQPGHIGEMREKLRNGGLKGKAVIRFGAKGVTKQATPQGSHILDEPDRDHTPRRRAVWPAR
jgi:D-arabinose 1-dehydrogenase-like Zn-dependent alcohol dehydrogenase